MRGVAYLGNGSVEVRDYPDPHPGNGEVLVAMKVAGLCGSDLHKYHMDESLARSRNGMIAGHEPAGIVTELGPGVDGVYGVRVGERVSVYHSLGCGRCVQCLSGMPVFCDDEGAFGRTRDGAHADYLIAPANCCLPLPDTCSYSAGAMLACTAGTAYAAVQKTGLSRGETCVVFGLGPVGLTTIIMAKALGFDCIGVEMNRYRLDLAKRLGGFTIVDAANEGVVERVSEHTSGHGVPAVIECSGSAVARTQAVEIAAVRGTVVLVGVGDNDVPVSPERIIRREITIRGNAVYSTSDYYRAVDLIERLEINLDSTVTHRFPIEDAVEAFELFDTGQTGKVVFTWE